VRFTRGWILYLRARLVSSAAALLVFALTLEIASGSAVYELQVLASKVPRYVPVWEFVPVVVASVIPALLAPQMWSWERFGNLVRLRICAFVTGTFALCAPALLTLASALVVLPNDARWADIALNVILVAAIAIAAVAFSGRVIGPLIPLTFYLGLVVMQQVVPASERWNPISAGGRSVLLQAQISLVFAVVGLTVWTLSLGRTILAERLEWT
jgi:hypothetical protein